MTIHQADPPAPPAPEPEPPKASLCFKAPPAGLGGLTAETIPCPTPVVTKNKLCFDPTVTGIDRLTAKTIPCAGEATPPAGDGVVTQLDDGQVVAPVSATGNPVSRSTVGAKGAADIVVPTLPVSVSFSNRGTRSIDRLAISLGDPLSNLLSWTPTSRFQPHLLHLSPQPSLL